VKCKMIALVLALTMMSWAQTSTQTAPAATQKSSEKAKCSCCDKMTAGDSKEGTSCCAHHDMKADDMKSDGMKADEKMEMASCCAGKDKASCCNGKDAKSCERHGKDKKAKACCGDKCSKEKMSANCCGGKCGKSCCAETKG